MERVTKNAFIGVRLSKAEKAEIENWARLSKISVSQFMLESAKIVMSSALVAASAGDAKH